MIFHVAATIQHDLLTLRRQFVGKFPKRIEENQRHEISLESVIYVSEIEFRCIQHQYIVRLAETVQEIPATLGQRTRFIESNHDDEAGIFIDDFEWAMEELIGVDSLRVDPQHFHEHADGE